MLRQALSWVWRRVIPKRMWLEASSQYEPVMDHFAYKIVEEYDRGADLQMYQIREYEDKDTGESVFWKHGTWTREFYEWDEFEMYRNYESVRYDHEMLVLPASAKPIEYYDLGFES